MTATRPTPTTPTPSPTATNSTLDEDYEEPAGVRRPRNGRRHAGGLEIKPEPEGPPDSGRRRPTTPELRPERLPQRRRNSRLQDGQGRRPRRGRRVERDTPLADTSGSLMDSAARPAPLRPASTSARRPLASSSLALIDGETATSGATWRPLPTTWRCRRTWRWPCPRSRPCCAWCEGFDPASALPRRDPPGGELLQLAPPPPGRHHRDTPSESSARCSTSSARSTTPRIQQKLPDLEDDELKEAVGVNHSS
ncbi:MAG: hypothetical protein WKG07_08930 [Hymenobacter sp.]